MGSQPMTERGPLDVAKPELTVLGAPSATLSDASTADGDSPTWTRRHWAPAAPEQATAAVRRERSAEEAGQQRQLSLLERRRLAGGRGGPSALSISCQARSEDLSNSELRARFEVFEQLGQGAAATVYRARRREDQQEVALKVVRTQDEEALRKAQREYELMRELRHPFIVRTLGFLIHPAESVLVLEYFEGAVTLAAGIDAAPGRRLREAAARRLLRCLVQATAYLHEQGIIHRDIKVQNALVSGDCASGDLRQLRLIDFNTAECILDSEALTMTGTPDYMPPEVLLGNAHGKPSDVWAAGICLHLMLAGVLPWERSRYRSHAKFGWALQSSSLPLLLAGEHWQGFSVPCLETLKRCLEVDPGLRPTAADLLRDAWLAA